MRTAARVTLAYVLLASGWILFSDLLVFALVPPGSSEAQLSIAKGLLFVAITGSSLFALVRANVRSIEEESRRVRAINEALVAREAELRLLSSAVEQSLSPIIITTAPAQRIEYVNAAFLERAELDREEVLGRTPADLAIARGLVPHLPGLAEAFAEGRPWSGEFPNRKRDGTPMLWYTRITPVHDAGGQITHFVGVHEDITARRAAEEALRTNLREKESLLKEIHHRVKNNLQIVSSLLYLQAKQTVDGAAKQVLIESQARIRSMAMVHESLYSQSDLAEIDLPRHLRGLCDYLVQSYVGQGPRLAQLALEVAPVSLDLDRAVPLSLLVVELVSNALKYAFPGERTGKISVLFERTPDLRYRLTVEDDGVGLPEGFDVARTSSLGLQLVTSLAGQLGGALKIGGGAGPGARFVVEMPTEDRRKS